MEEKEAKALIKTYIRDNFDDAWYPEPLYFKAYLDFFEFSINSKKYADSGNSDDAFIGLGPAYLSKTFGEIVQFGSAPRPWRKDFLKLEHKLTIVRKTYQLDRIDYSYKVVIKNIENETKASKYLGDISKYTNGKTFKELKHLNTIECSPVSAVDVLNLLYLNVIDPFCECTYRKLTFKNLNPSYPMDIRDDDNLSFQYHMIKTVEKLFPTFKTNECYSATITETYNKEQLYQYAPIAGFRYYGEDEPTGYIGYIHYFDHDIETMIENKTMSFEYVEGSDILFFLYINTMTPFCNIELKNIRANLKPVTNPFHNN